MLEGKGVSSGVVCVGIRWGAYTAKPPKQAMPVITHFRAVDMLRGLSGSSSPSQVTMKGSFSDSDSWGVDSLGGALPSGGTSASSRGVSQP